jgi:MoaA/NifB/PqqE/SkfB family radical SAM enzyme
MCDSWRKSPQDELSLKEIISIFNQLPRMDLVRLTGGEPFMRNDLIDIAHAAQEHLNPLTLHITTNGYLTAKIVRFCEARHKDNHLYLLISLDGLGEKHDAIRRQRNAWKHTVDTVKALVKRQKQLRMKLSVNQTIVSDEGLENYLQLRDYLKPLGIQNHIVIGYKKSAIYNTDENIRIEPKNGQPFNAFGKFNNGNLKRLFDAVQEDIRCHPPITRIAKRYYLDGIRNRFLHQVAHPKPKCVALSSHLRLLPDGSVPTCQFNTTVVGNLRYQKLNDIWHGSPIKRQRQWVNHCQGCWAECEILPNALYSGDIAGFIKKANNGHKNPIFF